MQRAPMGYWLSLTFGLYSLLAASDAWAFKLVTHIVLANDIAEQIEQTGKVVLRDVTGKTFKTFKVDRQLQDSIRRYKSAFVMGALGADVYPDLIAGQMTTHPGLPLQLGGAHERLPIVETLTEQLSLPHNDRAFGWQTDDWLAHVRDSALGNAKNKASPEVAFAYGYMLHAAMDTWAHSYVNLYTGDLFSMFKNQTAAARHVALEIYFKNAHAPYQPKIPVKAPRQSKAAATLIEIGVGKRPRQAVLNDNYSKLVAPARFVTRTVILNDDAAEQYSREVGATHLWAMWAWWKTAGKLRGQAENILTEFNSAAAYAQNQVAAADDVWQTLNTAQQALVTQTTAAYQAMQAAEQAAEDAAEELAAASTAVQSYVSTNPVLEAFFNTVNGAISRILDQLPPHMRTRYNNAVAAIPPLDTAFASARHSYRLLRERRDREAGKLQTALAELNAKQQALNGLQQLRRGLARSFNSSFRAWQRSIESAAEAYVVAFEETARELMRPHGNRYLPGSKPSWPLQAWAACWGPAFGLPAPSQLHSGCSNALTNLTRTQERLQLLITNAWTPQPVKEPLIALDEMLQDRLASALPDLAALVRNAIPAAAGATVPASAALAARLWDSDVSVTDLHQIYREDASELQLPTYRDGELIEMLRIDGLPLPATMDPRKAPQGNASVNQMRAFIPVGNAYTLAQLTLLKGSQLNELVASKMPSDSNRKPRLYPATAAAGAVLIGAIRSIDGNHQWRPTAPALIRPGAATDTAGTNSAYATGKACRRFGYPAAPDYNVPQHIAGCGNHEDFATFNAALGEDNKPPKLGMRLWNNPLARKEVFNCLFAGPLSVAQCHRAEGNEFAQHGCNGEPYPPATVTAVAKQTKPHRYQPQCLAENQISRQAPKSFSIPRQNQTPQKRPSGRSAPTKSKAAIKRSTSTPTDKRRQR
ncbi:MAG: hypothetical protein AB8B93_02825 [Pseudomonadales bacterium]